MRSARMVRQYRAHTASSGSTVTPAVMSASIRGEYSASTAEGGTRHPTTCPLPWPTTDNPRRQERHGTRIAEGHRRGGTGSRSLGDAGQSARRHPFEDFWARSEERCEGRGDQY